MAPIAVQERFEEGRERFEEPAGGLVRDRSGVGARTPREALLDPQLWKKLGTRLGSLRRAEGLTLRAIAARGDLEHAYLSKLERGKLPNMTLELLSRVSVAYRVPVVWMVEFLTPPVDKQGSKISAGDVVTRIESAGVEARQAIATWLCDNEPNLIVAAVRQNTSLRRSIMQDMVVDLSSTLMASRDPEVEFERRKAEADRRMGNTSWVHDDPET